MPAAVLRLHLLFPGCASLKEKRGRLKPILARLHREFNVSSAETGLNDHWSEAQIEVAMAAGERVFLERALQEVLDYTRRMWPDEPVQDFHIELY